MIGLRVFTALYGGGSAVVTGDTLKAWLFCGESTADGRGKVENVPITFDYVLATYNSIKAWNYITSSLTSYDAQSFNTYNNTNADKRFGLDAQFLVRAMQDNPGFIAMTKLGKGGTTLEPGVNANGNWTKGAVNTRYDVFIQAVNDMISELDSQGFQVEIQGVIFMIGLNDATDNTATANFNINLNAFIDNIYSDIDMGSAKIYIGLPHADADVDPTNLTSIRSDIQNNPDQRLIVVDNDATPLSDDDVHFPWDGEIEVGDRFYDAYLLNI